MCGDGIEPRHSLLDLLRRAQGQNEAAAVEKAAHFNLAGREGGNDGPAFVLGKNLRSGGGEAGEQ